MIDYKKKYHKYKFKYLNAKKLMYGRGTTASGDIYDDDDYDEPPEEVPIIESDELMSENDNINISLMYNNQEYSINVDPSSNVHETIRYYFEISDKEQISINLGDYVIIGEDATFEESDIEEFAKIKVHIEEDPNRINLNIYLIVGLGDRMPKRYHITLKNVPINTTIKAEDFLNIPNWPKRENIQANSSSNTSIFNATWSAAKKLAAPIKVTVAPNVTTEHHLYITNKYYYDRGKMPFESSVLIIGSTYTLLRYGNQFDIESSDLYLGQRPLDWYENTMLEDPEEITLYYPEE